MSFCNICDTRHKEKLSKVFLPQCFLSKVRLKDENNTKKQTIHLNQQCDILPHMPNSPALPCMCVLIADFADTAVRKIAVSEIHTGTIHFPNSTLKRHGHFFWGENCSNYPGESVSNLSESPTNN